MHTTYLELPYIQPSQAQKHVTHNEALRMLDALLHIRVEDRDRESPPVDPLDGQRHALGTAPIGAFAGHAGKLAVFEDGAWLFYQPQPGWLIWDASEEELLVYADADWIPAAPDPVMLPRLGINAVADDTNRLAVSSDATLLNHNGAGHQLKINKAAAVNTGSLLFQTAWSGHAELGLAGNNDFALKVSADGSTWRNALTGMAATGAVRIDSLGIGISAPTSELHLHSTRTTGLTPHMLLRAGKNSGQAASVAYQRATSTQQVLFAFETGSSSSPDGYFGTAASKEKALFIYTASGSSSDAALGIDRTLGFRVGHGVNITGTGSVGAGITAAGNAYFAGAASVGRDATEASAQLEVTSTTRGFLPPRLTATQRDAISSPAEGLIVYNTTEHKPQFWNGSAWIAMSA